MDSKQRRRWWWFCVSFGFCLGMCMGCQTWVPTAGVTLPSPSYLKHPPQYIPESPAFPLNREVQSLSDATKTYLDSQQGAGIR